MDFLEIIKVLDAPISVGLAIWIIWLNNLRLSQYLAAHEALLQSVLADSKSTNERLLDALVKCHEGNKS